MMSRRLLLASSAAAALSLGVRAQSNVDEVALDTPNEEGFADFAGAWELTDGGDVELVAAAKDLPEGYAKAFSLISFKSAAEIDQHFLDRTGLSYIEWFNSEVAGKQNWKGKEIVGQQTDFAAFWDQYLGASSHSLMQFLAYMSVFTNEVLGDLRNRSETYGAKDHPGISYLFDKVTRTYPDTGRTWTKASYNTGSLNRPAGALFADPIFNKAHAGKVLGNDLRDTSDSRWNGNLYPAGYPTSGKPDVSGYVLEADFFKFRGRGLIQTTWRANYAPVVDFIKQSGTTDVLQPFREAWSGISTDDVLTASSNADWDAIFNDPEKAVLCEAIKIHERPSRYALLSDEDDKINGKGSGSIIRMGNSIGGTGYGERLKARVRQICIALGMS